MAIWLAGSLLDGHIDDSRSRGLCGSPGGGAWKPVGRGVIIAVAITVLYAPLFIVAALGRVVLGSSAAQHHGTAGSSSIPAL